MEPEIEKAIDASIHFGNLGERRGLENAAYAFSEIIWKYRLMPFTEDAQKGIEIIRDDFYKWCEANKISGDKLVR